MRVSFFGHYHIETFNNMRSWESDKSFGVSHWSSSLTTYSEVLTPAYPSFRRFILDEETMLPVKIETYSMDINVEDPVFELDHEMTSLYGMPDLSPTSFDQLSKDLANDEDLAYVFERAKTAFGPNPLLDGYCDDFCREELFCHTSYGVHSDIRTCLG